MHNTIQIEFENVKPKSAKYLTNHSVRKTLAKKLQTHTRLGHTGNLSNNRRIIYSTH